MRVKEEINNTKDEWYSKQTNNERSAMIACFSTSMLNAAYGVDVIIPEHRLNASKYGQYEDKYDEFIYTPENLELAAKTNKNIAWGLNQGIQPRELWELQVFSFNRWVEYDACKILWKIKPEEFVTGILSGNTYVVGGVFCNLRHMVCVAGTKTEYDTAEGKRIYDLEKTKIIVDDSYGNPHKKYKPLGKDGNNVEFGFYDIWEVLHGNGKDITRYAIEFDKNARKKSPYYKE